VSGGPTEPAPGGGEPRPSHIPARARQAATRGTAVAERGRLWIENQDPSSRKGATIGWVRRYQAADGQLYAVLLSAYLLLTMLPVALVTASYVYKDPTALSDRIEHRLKLRGTTADLFSSVMRGTGEHKLSAVFIAIIDLFFFGLGFPRVFQLAQARSWGLDLRKSPIADQARYAEVLTAMVIGAILFVFQAKELQGDPSWIGWILDIVWVALLLAFFVWTPRLLLHHRVAARDLLPGAVFTVLGLVILRVISVLLLTHWLNWYSTTYGAFGIVIAIFFWIILIGTVLILAAALSPALAHRRDLRAARA
jgi:membrane protein